MRFHRGVIGGLLTIVQRRRWATAAIFTKRNRPVLVARGGQKKSRQRPTFAVTLSSALAGLTAVFGMGTGVTLPV